MKIVHHIIGLCGPAGAGKSTVAGMILSMSTNASIVPFATPIKDFARQLGWNGIKDEKGRRLLRLLGQECGRECIDEDIWIKKWLGSIRDAGAPPLVIVDDVRYINEAEVMDDLWEVTRPGVSYSQEHGSEKGIPLDMIDLRIINDSSKDQLRAKVKDALHRHRP